MALQNAEGQPDSTMQDIENMDCSYIENVMYIQGSPMVRSLFFIF